jgi:hypothetical protein
MEDSRKIKLEETINAEMNLRAGKYFLGIRACPSILEGANKRIKIRLIPPKMMTHRSVNGKWGAMDIRRIETNEQVAALRRCNPPEKYLKIIKERAPIIVSPKAPVNNPITPINIKVNKVCRRASKEYFMTCTLAVLSGSTLLIASAIRSARVSTIFYTISFYTDIKQS